MKRVIVLSVMVLASAGILQAQVLETVRVRASSFEGSTVLPRYAADGSGVLGDVHSNYPPESMWCSKSLLPVSDAWIECDLGEICVLSEMKLYNFNDKWSEIDNTNRGVRHFVILLSNDGVNYMQFGGTCLAEKAPGIPEDPQAPRNNHCMTSFDLTGAVARFVKIDIIDSYEAIDPVAVGLSELVFEGDHTGMGANVVSDDITVTPSSTQSGYDPQDIVNGNGLFAGWYGAHDWTLGGTGWMGNFAAGEVTLTFTFDEPKNLSAVRIWNLDSWWAAGNAAARDFEMRVSTDGANFNSIFTDQLNPYVGSTLYDYSLLFAMEAENVMAVQMVITSNYAGSGSTGLNEIQFVQATGPIIPLTLQGTSPDEHGHWYDSVDETYRVYDRWLFDANDIAIDLSQHDKVNFFIRPPAGTLVRVDESCSVSAMVSMYDTAWTSDPLTWGAISGSSQLQGKDVPVTVSADFGTKTDVTRQFSLAYVSDESAGSWLFRSLILTVDVSSLIDPQATYSFGHNAGSLLLNELTFSSMTESAVDTGEFTSLLADLDYHLAGFAQLASSWGSGLGDDVYLDVWDIVDDDVIDLADLTLFCENWLLETK
jgi:hypothetical protein